MGDAGGIVNALLLWVTQKMGQKPWITWVVGFSGGMIVGFLLWAIGVK